MMDTWLGTPTPTFSSSPKILVEEPEKVTRLFLFRRQTAQQEDVSRTSIYFNFKPRGSE